MQSTLDEDTRLVLRRTYDAPLDAVWAAWTEPAKMKHWMAPVDAQQESEVTVDLRIGGRYRIVMHAPDGQTHRVGGAYREIVPPRKLVYTWAWESTPEREPLVTVELRPDGGGTELLLTHQRFFDRDARDRHQRGWIGCLDRLALRLHP